MTQMELLTFKIVHCSFAFNKVMINGNNRTQVGAHPVHMQLLLRLGLCYLWCILLVWTNAPCYSLLPP